MADTSDKKTTGARVTVRLSDSEHTALRELAEARNEDLTHIIREAIAAYLDRDRDQAAHRAEHERLATDLRADLKREADRVIERQEQITRALIGALNQHLEKRR